MKRSERTYSEMFALLRDTPPATSFTPEEVQSLLESSSMESGPVAVPPSSMRMGRRVAIVAAMLTVSIAGVWMLQPDSVLQPDSARRIATPAQEKSVAPESRQAARTDVKAPVRELSATANNSANIPSAARPARIAPSSTRAIARQTPPSRAIDAPREDVDHATNLLPAQNKARNEIATLPMLDLNPEELKALGITFINGEIQTFGEEYYSLTTAEDRATFAQMGIDTTQRTGIVRMRLTIDTFGLTTRKHSWTRVENYSRIAPIIALNSYVGNGHGNAVALNTFNRSPIMDSANRSIGPMVALLAKRLEKDNIDRVLHDIDQANPARILVPVHIRLGDEQINGTKRRGADIILWYYPTPEFAAALPERYRTSLQKELNAIANVMECNLPPVEVCRQMTGEPLLLNYCKRTSGALRGLNMSPNPAHGSVTMRYMLETQRTITAALHGIRGEYIRELVPEATVAAGSHSVTVQLGKVTPGAYIVVMRSEHGEQVAERLIVQ